MEVICKINLSIVWHHILLFLIFLLETIFHLIRFYFI
jgi:hypothetical protein